MNSGEEDFEELHMTDNDSIQEESEEEILDQLSQEEILVTENEDSDEQSDVDSASVMSSCSEDYQK